MQHTVLLYGASGFSGRLIAARAKSETAPGGHYADCRMILAGRDGAELRKIANEHGFDFRVFALDEPHEILRHLDGVRVVINAAGPFAYTAMLLARAALRARCHYVDINGELDVYRTLDDLAQKVSRLGIVMVSGAAASAGASDVLLEVALRTLKKEGKVAEQGELGAIRIAMSQVTDFSRGTALTAARSLREQVLVVRKGAAVDARGRTRTQMVFWHEPVGRLERSFDFGSRAEAGRSGRGDRDRRIASAANLIDTPTALRTVDRHGLTAHAIESYVETGPIGRVAYQLGGMLSPLLALPWAGAAIRAQAGLLPEGPSRAGMQAGHVVVLTVEDVHRAPSIECRMTTPSVYQLTAQLAVAVACEAARGENEPGWTTPAQVLCSNRPTVADLKASSAFAGCSFEGLG